MRGGCGTGRGGSPRRQAHHGSRSLAPGRGCEDWRPLPLIPRLHLVTDDGVLDLPGLEARAEAALAAGGDRILFHLRGPRTTGRRLWEVGGRLVPLLREYGVPFVVNDRVDLALLIGARGAHLGERSLEVETARSLLGEGALVGRSVHSPAGARRIREGTLPGRGPDFLFGGSVYDTPSHPGEVGIGVRGLGAIVAAAGEIPVLGIGGIAPEGVRPLLAAGGYGVAVVRAVWDAEDPGEAVRALLGAIAAAEGEALRPGGIG